VTTPSEPPSSFDGEPGGPLPLQLELPRPHVAAPPADSKVRRRPRAARENRALLLRLLGATGVIGAAGLALVGWALPWYVRRQCIDEAAARGITLSIDSAQIELGGFRLLGLGATISDIPGLRAQVPEMRVQTSGFHPQAIEMRGAELRLAGGFSDVGNAFATWRSHAAGPDTGGSLPTRVTIDDSRIVWQGAIGENARVEASGAHLDVTWQGKAPELHFRSDRVMVAIPGGALGPWRVDYDRAPSPANERALVPASARLRLALDPGVPDASTLLVVADDERVTSVDVAVPRSPLGRLGLPPALLGLRGSDLQLEVSAHYGASGPKRADARTKGGLYGIQATGIPRAIDVAWDVAASGSTDAGLDLKVGRLAVGPLVGAMTGMLKSFDDGFRVDLAWKAGPVPCNAFDAPLGSGAPFDIGYQLRKLAEATGITKIDGEVTARAALAFDSRDLGLTRLDFVPDAKCRVALFAP
jgi:hypothetical protein